MKPHEEWQLPTQQLGRRVLVFDRVDSTNDLAAALAGEPDSHGVAVLAAEQTAGRGQHGRTWSSPPGSSVLLSVFLLPPLSLRRPALLTAWAAVSVCETVRQLTGREATIKWPNDVLILGRKVCGILIEQGRGTVVGIGLNVNQSAEAFAQAGLPHATSLASCDGTRRDFRHVARELITRLDIEYQGLCTGDLRGLERRWVSRLALLDRLVTIESHAGTQTGQVNSIGWHGVTFETPDGQVQRLPAEAIRHIEPV